ncbi:MAG: hypothetical protein GFH27_549301n130 [Chloroflexi bacterium AL-W]|nr:hypothetical protein [Chloroflexi bacterium AL-N1]NOK68323.1 hypothetical protein [Chloroflexi bacterium AL-N10]NOK73969.1 hypothetical protein [Chloroflexi bacterium AL-N5]NOK82937.1 hypothetical protein [Chloroflexi bacterium AL-W]NOK90459.1 hypothetical protein [Chloroflexi bacterium AL-N15]
MQAMQVIYRLKVISKVYVKEIMGQERSYDLDQVETSYAAGAGLGCTCDGLVYRLIDNSL